MAYIKNLRVMRENAGISVSELAKTTGLDRGTISRAEKNKNARKENLIKIVHALNGLFYTKDGHPVDLNTVIFDELQAAK